MFLPVNKKLKATLTIKDKFGNAATVDGAPQWALSAELGTLEVAEDGMSATFTPAGTVGSLEIQVKADADKGEGVKEILGKLALDLLAGEAEVIELSGAEVVAE